MIKVTGRILPRRIAEFKKDGAVYAEIDNRFTNAKQLFLNEDAQWYADEAEQYANWLLECVEYLRGIKATPPKDVEL